MNIGYLRNLIFKYEELYVYCGEFINIHDDEELMSFYETGFLADVMREFGIGDLEIYDTEYNLHDKFDYSYKEDEIVFECPHCFKVTYMIDEGKKSVSCKYCNEQIQLRKIKTSSYGEQRVKKLLDTKKLSYEVQYPLYYDNSLQPLRFDFVVEHEDKYYYIEVNGKQHYEPVEFFGGESGFEETLRRYNIKKEYAEKNGVFIELNYREGNLDLLEGRFYKEFYNKYIKGEGIYE